MAEVRACRPLDRQWSPQGRRATSPCTGIDTQSLYGCDANAAADPASALCRGHQLLTITAATARRVTVLTSDHRGAANASIDHQRRSTSLQQRTIYTALPTYRRALFVGEDPVTCTGFRRTQPPLTGSHPPTGCTRRAAHDRRQPIRSTPAPPRRATPLLNGFIKIEKQNARRRLDRRDDGDPEPRLRRIAISRAGSAAPDPTSECRHPPAAAPRQRLPPGPACTAGAAPQQLPYVTAATTTGR